MTPQRHSPIAARTDTAPGRAADTGQAVLLVAACTGVRCAALRRLDSVNQNSVNHTAADVGGNPNDTRPPQVKRPESDAVLRAAIRQRCDAILLSVPCLGPCHYGSLTAIGRAMAGPGDHELNWLGRPTMLARTELPARARALAKWITSTAPDLATLPEPLLNDGANP